jgi:hypothetical protein
MVLGRARACLPELIRARALLARIPRTYALNHTVLFSEIQTCTTARVSVSSLERIQASTLRYLSGWTSRRPHLPAIVVLLRDLPKAGYQPTE